MLRRAVLSSDHERGFIDLRNLVPALAVYFSICLAACVNFEKQRVQSSPLGAAELRLTRAERQKLDVTAQAGEYLAVASIAERQLDSTSASETDRSSATVVYNRATADLASDLPALIDNQRSSKTLVLKNSETGETERLHLDSGAPGEYDAAYFQEILVAAQIDQKRMKEHATRQGVGGTVVGVHHSNKTGEPPPRLEPQRGLRATMTAIVRTNSSHGSDASLQLLDPTKLDIVVLNKKSYALAADYTAAQASYGRVAGIWLGFLNMIRGEHMRGSAGLLFLQPYDPDKIPVIFVHGLLSAPSAWANVASSLSADPQIRRHFQFWVFSYPTGNPIAYSALILRQDLTYAETNYHFRQAILVGHSMGGILSRLQVTNSGRTIWDTVIGPKADSLYASQPNNSTVKQALIFSSDPTIKRVIFVATPHRGSSLATNSIGALGMMLIRLPVRVLNAIPKAVIAAISPNNDPRKFRPPTSISGLSPRNPLLLAMEQLPIGAPHNSIIGDRGRNDTPYSSDGVVPYWSSHLDSAQSELIVPTGHGAMENPKSVQEIRRILLEQIGVLKANRQQAKVPQYGTALLPTWLQNYERSTSTPRTATH